MRKILVVVLITNAIVLCMSANVVDFLMGRSEGRQDNSAGSRNCICNGPSCICCLDLNISFVNLGGPGCIRLHYLSPDEGIAINVSYGESLLHNEVVKGPDPLPSCLNIFANFAQMCARFNGLVPTDDGLRGCVNLEPMLLGVAQLELPIGCFRMGPNGMEVIQSPDEIISETRPELETDKVDGNSTGGDGEGPDSLAGYTAEDILAAVNESAEQGIALITNWFGIAPNATDDEPENTNAAPATQPLPVTEVNNNNNNNNHNNYQPSQSQQNSGHVVFG